ncbi:MAG TPA: DNA-binding protein [Janthinobacterium sp.]|nr:DNA-binding protein [Janthinobacterium sp.]
MNAFVIDAFDFCRINGSREGVTPVAEMTRLIKDCADASGSLAWKVEGGTSKLGYPQLTLSVTGTVQLMCQRCLTPFAYDIDASTALMLGKDDEHADEIEDIIDDESIDVIVGSRAMNVADLIEDEALLSLPQVPKHDTCPDTVLLDAVKTEKKLPFAGLKDLKQAE